MLKREVVFALRAVYQKAPRPAAHPVNSENEVRALAFSTGYEAGVLAVAQLLGVSAEAVMRGE